MIKLSVSFIICVCLLLPAVQAQTTIQVGETNPPQNLVLLIVDGMGSPYVCPASNPKALDSGPIDPARVPVLHGIISRGLLVPEVIVPTPSTGPAHSVIITGYSGAEQEMVEYPGATIFDVLDDEGFLSMALMHKGDFAQMRSEQDIILYSESNSINEPSLKVQVNDNRVPADLINQLEHWEQRLPSYLEGTSGIDTYNAYSTWELEAAEDIISLMSRQHDDINYIFTINVGVVDCAGHYRGVTGYIDSIEGIDSGLEQLYDTAMDSGTAFVITADHGMAFKYNNASRGGHASEDYYSYEAVTVPLIISSPNVEPGLIGGEFGQEDVAPTLLSILDIPVLLKYTDGEAIPVKDYANLWVSSGTESDVEILQGTDRISGGTGDSFYIFTGLKPKINYIVKVSNGDNTFDQTVDLDVDRLVRFETTVASERGWDNGIWRKGIAAILIFIVVIGGLLLISRIRD